MALWTNVDQAAGAPKNAVASGLGVSATGSTLYGNTTPDVFKTGIELGVFGVSPNETVGVGNVSTVGLAVSNNATISGNLTVTGDIVGGPLRTDDIQIVGIEGRSGLRILLI